MRRGLLIAAVLTLAVVFALWFAARVERSPLARLDGAPRVPDVLAGRDRGEPAARTAVREGQDTAMVRCRFDGEGAAGRLLAMGERAIDGAGGGVDLSLALPPGAWTVVWENAAGRMLPLGSVEVEGGEVFTCRLAARGWEVRGTVRTEDGRGLPDVEVRICGARVRTEEDGTFDGIATSGSCTLRAIVYDGVLARRSKPVTRGPFEAGPVELVVDDAPIAGMGLAFRMTEGGAQVMSVHAGSPAELAGVEAGDLILSVNGTSTAGLTDDAFIALGTGREGTRVALAIEHDGETTELAFTRKRIASAESLAPVGNAGDTGE